MKKILLSIAALLFGLLAYSQEADTLGKHAEVTIIPRLDVAPTFVKNDSKLGFNHGNSSLYTLFEGSASEHFSWTIANHWLSLGDNMGWPYQELGYSNSNNLFDYFRADLNFGNWTFSLGKDVISTGGFEYDSWDWEIYTDFATPLWNGLPCYQWGGKVAFATPSGKSNFSLQMTSSPYGERPFASGLWTYSAQWKGEYGCFSNIWSVSALQKDKDNFYYLISLGQRVSLDKWELTLDLNNNAGFDDDGMEVRGFTAQGTVKYSLADNMNIALKGTSVNFDGDSSLNDINIGTIFEYYPLSDSEDLRLHAYLNYDKVLNCTTLGLGALYNLRLKLW